MNLNEDKLKSQAGRALLSNLRGSDYRQYLKDLLAYKKQRQAWLERQSQQDTGPISSSTPAGTATQRIASRAISALTSPEARDAAKSGLRIAAAARRGKLGLLSKTIKQRNPSPPEGPSKGLTALKRIFKPSRPGQGNRPPTPTTGGNTSTPSTTPPTSQSSSSRTRTRTRRSASSSGNSSATSTRTINYTPRVEPVNVRDVTGEKPTLPARKPVKGLLPPSSSVKENYFGTEEFETYLNENYSCWKEEFLVELGELRKKAKDKKVIDVMRGKNKVTLNPTVTEEMNTSSIFAKATPPLKKRTTPMSDIVLSKQPGKGTAERVRYKMSKLFLGDLRGYNSNYDYSLTPHSNSQAPNGD